MPTYVYEHVDPMTRCSLGREFQLFRGVNACDLKLCDICNQPIREAVKKTAPLPPFNAGGTTSQSITG